MPATAQDPIGGKALSRLGLFLTIGASAIVVFALGSGGSNTFVSAAVGLLTAGAAAMVGGFLGFLFGIPRALREEATTAAPPGGSSAATQARRRNYENNTNLEQISDWLTKILVGVGLVELGLVPQRLADLAAYLSAAFNNSVVVAISITLYFVIGGFLFGYLWTRLYMIEALQQADAASQIAQLKSEIEQQADDDARALVLARQQLNPGGATPPPTEAELTDAFTKAKPSARSSIRQEAMDAQRPDLAIPVFRALAGLNEYFDDHAQLAYRLKDLASPDWATAEKELTAAINRRGPMLPTFGWYEFYRAVCRIHLEPDQTKPSPDPEHVLIDLRAAAADPAVVELLKTSPDPDVLAWLARNHIALASFAP